MTQPRLIAGVWKGLFAHALTLVDEIARRGSVAPFWTFGGGTVLMLRYRHRRSRDIDIFVPDPQYLGYVTPRLSAVAEAISADYVEEAAHVKLIRPEGEIDFVAGPNLTAPAFESWRIAGREVRAETAVEIVAKKMWYRGATATARSLRSRARDREGAQGTLRRRTVPRAASAGVPGPAALSCSRLARTVRRNRRNAISALL